MNCPKCNTNNPDEVKFCNNCGSAFAEVRGQQYGDRPEKLNINSSPDIMDRSKQLPRWIVPVVFVLIIVLVGVFSDCGEKVIKTDLLTMISDVNNDKSEKYFDSLVQFDAQLRHIEESPEAEQYNIAILQNPGAGSGKTHYAECEFTAIELSKAKQFDYYTDVTVVGRVKNITWRDPYHMKFIMTDCRFS